MLSVSVFSQTKADTLVVTTTPKMHCEGCENKTKSNIRFVKGTKQIETSVPNQTVTNLATGHSEHFDINGYKKYCLENALDDIDFLVQSKDKIEAFEAAHRH